VPLETVSTSQTSAQSEDAFDFDGDRSEVLGRAYIDESDKEAGLFHQGQRPKELAARHLEAAQEVIEKMCMRENVAQFQSQVTSEDVNSTQLWDVMANSVLRPPKSSKASLGRRSFPPPVVPSHERVFAGPLHAAASASGCKPCSNSKEGPVTANGVKKTQTVSAFVDELSKLLPHRQSGFFANSPREDSDDLLRELRLGADLPRKNIDSGDAAAGREGPQFRHEDVERMREVFDACDVDGIGKLTKHGLEKVSLINSEVARFFGINHFTGEQKELSGKVDEIFRSMNSGSAGEIGWEAFRDFWVLSTRSKWLLSARSDETGHMMCR